MKRRAVKLVVFLLAGAIVNVGVAWGCVLGVPPIFRHIDGMLGQREISDQEALAAVAAALGKDRCIDPETVYATRYSRVGWERQDFAGGQPEEPEDLSILAAGWPCYSVRGHWYGNLREEKHVGAIRVPRVLTPSPFVDFVPFHPIWPGFAINTVFYAAIVWLVFATPIRFRRWRRIKRGLCARCGYPVGSSALCSECGEKIHALHGAAAPCNPRRPGDA